MTITKEMQDRWNTLAQQHPVIEDKKDEALRTIDPRWHQTLVTIRIPTFFAEELTRVARREGLSRSEMLRRLALRHCVETE